MRRALQISLMRCGCAPTFFAATTPLAAAVRPQSGFSSGAPPGTAESGRNEHLHPPTGVEKSPPLEEEFQPPKKPSEAPTFLKVRTDDKGITNLQLARSPVNSFNLEFLQELNQWLLWLGSNEEARAVVLTSAIPTVFSAGLDLAELHNPKQERLVQFWQSFQELWLILNSFPKPIVGAITGNSPAAGCVVAMGCDYRVMARGPKGDAKSRLFRIGLNETKLGLTTPPWAMPAYAYLLGSRQAERLLQLGETPTADEALRIGLIDEVAEDEEKTIEAAFHQAERFLAVPQQSRWMSRDMMRREYLQMLASDEDRNYDTEFNTQFLRSPEVQKALSNYLERLKSKSRK
ncbi:unnamed protein product, partial [Phytomonas sp. EM1]